MVTDEEVYAKYSHELMRYANALVGPSAAEDVFASAVAGALHAPTWPAVTNKRAYLYSAVTNQARRLHRSTGRRLVRERRAASPQGVESAPTDPDVLAAMRRLSVRQRGVVYLTYWADLPQDDVAAALGCSRRTVERELAAARARLEVLLS